ARASTGSSGDSRGPLEGIAAPLEDVDEAFTTDHIDSLPRCVEEQIVGVSDYVRGRRHAARATVEHDQTCRQTAADEYTHRHLVERHRIVGAAAERRPSRDDCARLPVADYDLRRENAGEIREDALAARLELE